jgi:hypothetical protein
MISFIPRKDKTWVTYLGWSADSWLVLSHGNIDSGVGTYVLGDSFSPSTGQIQTSQASLPGGLQQWNPRRTAFVTTHYSGDGSCANSFSGYDFTTHVPLPDILAELGLPNAEAIIEPRQTHPMTWWESDDLLLLLITPLEYDTVKDDYKFMPRIAAQIWLSPEGPLFKTLGRSPSEDFSFTPRVGDGGFMAQPAPYQARFCQGEN